MGRIMSHRIEMAVLKKCIKNIDLVKTIVYATDYSPASIAALLYASGITKALGVRMVLTHVYQLSAILGSTAEKAFPELSTASKSQERKKLKNFYEKYLGKVEDDSLVRFEPVAHTSIIKGIVSKAMDWQAFAIFMGMKMQNKLREVIVGSTVGSLFGTSPCPVWAIPSDTVYAPLETIVYASDFEEEDIYAIRSLAEMASPFRAEIRIVHIATEKEFTGAVQMDWFREFLGKELSYKHIRFELLLSNHIQNRLVSYLKEEDVDLLVMLERENKSFLEKWLRTDMVNKMESYAKIPLLVFREHNHQVFYFAPSYE